MNLPDIDLARIAIQVGILLLSLSIHESAHAWSADRLGDPTARQMGRVSFNPLVHIDPIGTLLFPLLGMLFGGVIFGWAKPVPVHTGNLANPRKDHLLIAAAGPASNLILALLFLGAFKALGAGGNAGGGLFLVWFACYFGLILNVVLAVFNLLPLPPLDGSWILSGLLPESFSGIFDTIRPYSFVLLIMLLYSGFLNTLLDPILAFVQRIAL